MGFLAGVPDVHLDVGSILCCACVTLEKAFLHVGIVPVNLPADFEANGICELMEKGDYYDDIRNLSSCHRLPHPGADSSHLTEILGGTSYVYVTLPLQ